MKHLNLTEPLYDYLLDISSHESEVLKALREETASIPLAIMQIPPEQAQFFQFLLRLIHAKSVLDIGTFTGYSALAMAEALPQDGHLITCDISEEWTSIARRYWKKAHLEDKIECRIAPALNTLRQLLKDQQLFDFIFIDADKTNYLNYYELALQLLTPKGLIAIDNIFWEGQVIDPHDISAQTRDIRALNLRIKQDDRVFVSLLPIADGVFLVQPKRNLS